MNVVQRLKGKLATLSDIASRIHRLQEAIGRIEQRQIAQMQSTQIQDVEFRVFSQWGEDGIIQFLINNLEIPNKTFIEFGVENYTESSTRFLLCANNWRGLVIDGSETNISFIKNDPIYWRHNIKAECCFVTRDNINQIFQSNGLLGDIGILSIDIDGNDYWVWKNISVVKPAIVIMEYNARLGTERALTTPYDPSFIRSRAHHSCIYYGASLKALYLLGMEKGYAFVGCNSVGNNAFFVRRDLIRSPVKELSVEQGFVECQFREARGPDGNLLFLDPSEEKKILDGLPWVDVETSSS